MLLGSVIHPVLWPLTLYALWSPAARGSRRAYGANNAWSRLFGAWLARVSGLTLVSLAMDAKHLLSAVS